MNTGVRALFEDGSRAVITRTVSLVPWSEPPRRLIRPGLRLK